MTYSHAFINKEDYLLCVMSGEIKDAENMISCGQTIVPETKSRGYSRLLLDDRGVKLSLSPYDVTVFGDHILNMDFAKMGLRIAVVFPPQNKEITNFFETALSNRSFSFRAFDNIEDAEEWLLLK